MKHLMTILLQLAIIFTTKEEILREEYSTIDLKEEPGNNYEKNILNVENNDVYGATTYVVTDANPYKKYYSAYKTVGSIIFITLIIILVIILLKKIF